MLVIGIHGKKRSGKDTMANYMKRMLELQGENVKVFSFASPLKKATSELFCIPMKRIEEKEVPLDDWDSKTPRYLLQSLGDAARQLFPDIFIRTMKNRIDQCKNNTIVIISDIRFNDEAKLVHNFNGKVFTVDASKRLKFKLKDNHCSEKGIDPKWSDYTIYNNLDIPLFFEEINRKMKETFFSLNL